MTEKTTTETWEGSGTIQLQALPGAMTPVGGWIHASAITATERFALDARQEGRPDGQGCTTILTWTDRLEGSGAIIPPETSLEGNVSVLFDGENYTLSVFPFLIDISGTMISDRTTRCPGLPDDIRINVSDITSEAGPDFSGQSWTRQLDPSNPGVLSGTASFTDPADPWVTIDVTWNLRRP